MKNSHRAVFIIVVLFSVLAPAVFGANLLDNVLAPLKGINIAQLYAQHHPLIDAIIYFVLFIGVAKTTLGEKFKESNSVPTVVGIILAIGMLVFEYRSGFNLGKLAPIAVFVLFLIFGTFIYKYTKNLGSNTLTAAALAFAIAIILINIAAPQINEWIDQITWLSAIKNIILIVAFGALIMSAAKLLRGTSSGENAFRRAERKTDYGEKRERNIEEKEHKSARRMMDIESEAKKFEENIEKLEQVEKQFNEKENLERKNQLELLKNLEATVQGTWKFQQGLRNIHKNLNNPAFAAEKDKIDAYKTNFEQYVERLKKILASLKQHFDYSKNKADEYSRNIETQLNTDLNRLLDENIKVSEEADKQLKDMKGTVVYAELHSEYEKLRESSIENIRNQKNLKDNEKRILEHHKNIRDADAKNLRDIDEAIRIISSDSLNKLTFVNRVGNIVPMGIYNDNTLYKLNDIIRQMRQTLEKIISLEDSGDGKTAMEERNKNLEIAEKLDKEIRSKYGAFEVSIIQKTKNYYNIINKIFIEKGIELLNIANTLKAEKGLDPGLKSKEVNDAKIKAANMVQKVRESSYKEDTLIQSLVGYILSLEKMCNSFTTKDGKINGRTQSNINTWITSLSQKIENIKKDTDKENTESKPLESAFENLSALR